MDVSEMSLINKMLQDLEGRRSEGQVAGAMQAQVRAAPEPKRMHVAWWLVLGLSLILTGVISWLWGYRAAPTVASEAPTPQLALKPAPSIEAPQPVVAAAAAPAVTVAAPESPVRAETAPSAPVVVATSAPIIKESESVSGSTATTENQAQVSAARIVTSQASQSSQPPRPPRQELASTSSPTAALPSAVTPSKLPPAVVPVSKAEPAVTAGAALPAAAAGKTGAATMADASKANRVDSALQKVGKETEFDIPPHVAKQIKELTPAQRAEEEFRRATVLIDQARSSEAIAVLEKALQLDPQHSVARQTLAGLLLDAKRPDDAIRKLQDGLNVDRNHPALAMMLARLQVDRGDLRPAVETLQRTLSYASERADYQAFLAALLQREGRHKEAAEHFALALRKSPQNGLWWMGIAISLQADNRLAEARDAFGRARESNSLSPELLAFVNQKLNLLR
jgi:MSHA biogenesis protein MshN